MRERKVNRCRWCLKGYTRRVLDADGTLAALSGRSGIWGHARDDHFWPCERDYPLPLNMERYRDPFELLRDAEQDQAQREGRLSQ